MLIKSLCPLRSLKSSNGLHDTMDHESFINLKNYADSFKVAFNILALPWAGFQGSTFVCKFSHRVNKSTKVAARLLICIYFTNYHNVSSYAN